MAIVDERGRIGGKVNLIDAVVAVAIVGLIPVAFGAYLLFRTPQPQLLSVTPPSLYQGPNLRVTIVGENLRPFMRVTFDTTQGRTFLIGSTTYAVVDVPDLQPGTYDVVLWDYMQEVSRLPKAFSLLPLSPTPTIEMEVTGSFKGVAPDRIAKIKAGDKFPQTGTPMVEVVSVGSATPSQLLVRTGAATLRVPVLGQTDLPAVLRVKCFTVSNQDGSLRCAIAGPVQQADVLPGSVISVPGPDGWLSFQISEVLPAQAH